MLSNFTRKIVPLVRYWFARDSRYTLYLSLFQPLPLTPFSHFQKVWRYAKLAVDIQTAIDNILWNKDEEIWLDYDRRTKRSRNTFYPSNLTPLYTMSYNRNKTVDYALQAISYLKRNQVDLYFGKFSSIV